MLPYQTMEQTLYKHWKYNGYSANFLKRKTTKEMNFLFSISVWVYLDDYRWCGELFLVYEIIRNCGSPFIRTPQQNTSMTLHYCLLSGERWCYLFIYKKFTSAGSVFGMKIVVLVGYLIGASSTTVYSLVNHLLIRQTDKKRKKIKQSTSLISLKFASRWR